MAQITVTVERARARATRSAEPRACASKSTEPCVGANPNSPQSDTRPAPTRRQDGPKYTHAQVDPNSTKVTGCSDLAGCGGPGAPGDPLRRGDATPCAPAIHDPWAAATQSAAAIPCGAATPQAAAMPQAFAMPWAIAIPWPSAFVGERAPSDSRRPHETVDRWVRCSFGFVPLPTEFLSVSLLALRHVGFHSFVCL